MKNPNSRGIISPLAILFVPAGLALGAAVGALFGLLTIWNPHALLNAGALLLLAFSLGFISIWTVRLSKLRNPATSFVLALAFTCSFIGASPYAAAAIAPPPASGVHSIWSYLGERRAAGVTLIAGFVAIKGWLLITGWFLGATLVALAAAGPCLVESLRPFCPRCRSWAWKTRWRFSVPNPGESALAELRSAKSFTSLVQVQPGGVHQVRARLGAESKRLEVRLGACNCGRMAAIAASLICTNAKNEKSSDPIMADLPAPPATRLKLFEWAESIDPSMQHVRPRLAAAPPPSGEPLSLDPADGEHASYTRWSAPLGASDSYCDNEYTRELRRRLEQGEYDLVEQALRAQRHAEDLAFVAEACADWTGRPQWMDDWETARPGSHALLLVRGINSVKRAWQARGSDWVPKNYAQFQSHLHQAVEDLHAAAAAAPRDPTPWAWLIYASKGLQEEQEVIKSLLAEAHKRTPFHRPAYSMARDAFASKWGGTDARMMELARRVLGAAPAGSHVHVLVPESHLECAASAWRNDGKEAGLAYWKSPAVADELRRASEKCFRPGAHRPTMDTPRTRAFFAYALWKAGAKEHAAEHLRIIGKTTPWGPFVPNIPFMKDSVRRARKACGV